MASGYQVGWVWGFERLVLTIEPMTFQQSTMPSDLMIMFKINILWKVQLDIDLISQMHAGLVLLESQKQRRVGAKCQIIKAAAVCIEVVDIQQRCTTRCYLRSAGLNLNLQYRSQMKVESPRCRQSSPRQHSSPSPPPASQSFQSLAGKKKNYGYYPPLFQGHWSTVLHYSGETDLRMGNIKLWTFGKPSWWWGNHKLKSL